MKQPDDPTRFGHMLDHAREAVAMVKGRQFQDLDHDRMLELSLTRLVEIVGEAASSVSNEGQSRFIHIPWPQVISMRHR